MTETALEVVSCLLLYASSNYIFYQGSHSLRVPFSLPYTVYFGLSVRFTPVTAHTSTALSDATNSTGPRLVQSRNERRHVCVVVMWVYPSDWSLARRPNRRRRALFVLSSRSGYHLSGGAFEVITTRRHWEYASLPSSRTRSRWTGNSPQ